MILSTSLMAIGINTLGSMNVKVYTSVDTNAMLKKIRSRFGSVGLPTVASKGSKAKDFMAISKQAIAPNAQKRKLKMKMFFFCMMLECVRVAQVIESLARVNVFI